MAKLKATQLSSGHAFVFLALVAYAWIGYLHAPSPSSARYGLANTVLMLALGFIVLVVQNFAMVLAARALGDRIIRVTIGVGPRLWSRGGLRFCGGGDDAQIGAASRYDARDARWNRAARIGPGRDPCLAR
jgi:hypothetical protein